MKYLHELVDDYLLSHEYLSLRNETKKNYTYLLSVILDTKVETKEFNKIRLTSLSTRYAKLAYNKWCDRGISLANHVRTMAGVIFNHGIRMEYVTVNPFAAIKRRTKESRKVIWSKEHIKDFLDVAYSDFKTRNIGLIAQMAYEWCQRLGDMRLLKWDNFDMSKRRVHIEQSKRRAEVFLPISDELFKMLEQQKEDFDFQEYVAPRPMPYRGRFLPYSEFVLPKFAKRIMSKANLPSDLRLSDLRRTGTTEMVEAGVDITQIMAVTGHSHPQSVQPYIKNTFDSANNALTKRQNYGK
tara:strand:+ start:584 stop:1474 length:891 start_codon:yes stop_codon:yes gene_type:complete